MITGRYTTKMISGMMTAAVLGCFLAMLFPQRFAEALGGSALAMQYQEELFDTDSAMQIDILMAEAEWEDMLENASAEEYYSCDVVINGQRVNHVGIRPKGNTSLSAIVQDPDSDRYSLKLEFDHYVDGQTCMGLDKLILNNNYADATNMKEAVVYDMYQYLGADASLYNYAEISVNGVYWGVYLALEAVEDSFLLRNYGAEDGALYKPDSMGGGGSFDGADFGFRNGGGKDAAPGMGGVFGFPGDGEGSDFGVPGDGENGAPEFRGNGEGGGSGFPGDGGSSAFGLPGNGEGSGSGVPGDAGGSGFGFPETEAGGLEFPGDGEGSDFGVPGDGENGAPEFRGNGEGGGSGFPGDGGSSAFGLPGNGEGSGSGVPGDAGGSGFGFPETEAGGFEFPDSAGNGGFEFPDRENMPGGGGPSMGGNGSDLNYTDDDLDSYSAIWEGEVGNTSEKSHRRVVNALKHISEGTELETCLDIDNVLKYMAVHTFAVNMDSLSGNMAHNYYLYEYNGKLNMIPWDYNLAFGGMSMGAVSSASDMVNYAIDTPFQGTDFFDALLENEEYLSRYHEYIRKLTEEYVRGGRFEDVYSRIRNQIDALVKTDPTAFYSYEEYDTGAGMLRQAVLLRAESIQKQLDGSIPSTDAGQRADSSGLVDASAINVSAMGVFHMGGQRFQFNGVEISFSEDNSETGQPDADLGQEVPKGEDAESDGARENSEPDAPQGETAKPDATQGGNAGSDVLQGGNAEPDTSRGENAEPDAPQGENAEPDVPEGRNAEPDVPKEGNAEPEVPKEGNAEPEMSKAEDAESDVSKGENAESDVPKMESTQPGSPENRGQETEGAAPVLSENLPQNFRASDVSDSEAPKVPGTTESFGDRSRDAAAQNGILCAVSLAVSLAALFAVKRYKRVP